MCQCKKGGYWCIWLQIKSDACCFGHLLWDRHLLIIVLFDGCCVHHLCNIGCWSLSLSSLYTAQKGVFYVPLQIYWFYDDDVLTEGCSNRWTIKCFYVGMVYNAQRFTLINILFKCWHQQTGGKCERNKCLPVNNFHRIHYISAILYVIWIYYMIT